VKTFAYGVLIVSQSIGFVGQRSRMCFVGGIRDFILVRDTFLLKGLVTFELVAWLAFPLAGWIGGATLTGSASPDLVAVLLTALGGFGVGYFSILANGCPFRQHVLAAQGTVSSMTYLAGFFVGAIIFHALVAPLLVLILP
jgi:hypothetical protein